MATETAATLEPPASPNPASEMMEKPFDAEQLRKGFLKSLKKTPDEEKAEPFVEPAKEPEKEPEKEVKPPKAEEKSPAAEPEKAPAEEKAPGEEVPVPKSLTGKAADGWKAMNKDLREKTSQVKRLEQENKELREAKPAPPAGDLALVTAQRDQALEEAKTFRKELSTVKLERTPEFRRAYAEPILAAEKQIAEIAKGGGITAADALNIANDPDAASRRARTKELVAEMDHLDQQDMRSAIETLATKRTESTRVLSDAQAALDLVEKSRKEEQDRQAAAQKNQFNQEAEDAFKTTFKNISESNLSLLKKIPGNDAWNEQIDKIKDLGVKIDRDPTLMANHEARANMIYQAIGYEIAVQALRQYRETTDKKVTALEEEKTKLETALARYVKGTPGAGSERTPEPEQEIDEKTSLSKRVAKEFDKRTSRK